ncbi:MAG: hypothetical protein AABY53_09250 [Bdellovibrionota bacterium]
MIHHKIKLLVIIFLFCFKSFSAVSSVSKNDNEKLIQELTGRSPNSVAKALPKSAAISERHLQAGINAFRLKNYIRALKHFNTVIVKHSKSKEVRSAYLAKAKLYKEMGLMEQAEQNKLLGLKHVGQNKQLKTETKLLK